MSEKNCTDLNCVVHTRTDGVKRYSDGTGFAAKVTYVGENVVLTKVNSTLFQPAAQLLRLLGAPADLFYTAIVKVGENGNLSQFEDGDEFPDFRYLETHTLAEGDVDEEALQAYEVKAENHHDTVVDALKAETLGLEGVTEEQYKQIMFTSIKKGPFEGPTDGDDDLSVFI